MEEQVGPALAYVEVSQLVDDEQLRVRVVLEALLEDPAGLRVLEVLDEPGVNLNLNLPRLRLHPYAAVLAAPSICLASNSSGLRCPRAEWIRTRL